LSKPYLAGAAGALGYRGSALTKSAHHDSARYRNGRITKCSGKVMIAKPLGAGANSAD